MADDDFGFAPPPFNPESALMQFKRSCRDLKLTERAGGFEWSGKRALEWQAEADHLLVRLAKRLTLSPEWERITVRNAADQRKLIDELKRRLERWRSDD